jgi:hypothetical protein
MNDVAEHEKSSSARDRALEDKWQNAREQAQAQFESIREMVEALEASRRAEELGEPYDEDPVQRIHEDALSVEVRSDWECAGNWQVRGKPAEYRILLCTGGSAVQITGKLSEHGEPETACLQMQDWFPPWMEYWPPNGYKSTTEILLAYARQFYFGE